MIGSTESSVAHINIGHYPLLDKSLNLLGIRGNFLVEPQPLIEVGKTLGINSEMIEFAKGLELRRSVGKGLSILQETSMIAAIGELSNNHLVSAISLFGTSLLANGALFVEASYRDRMVGTLLKEIASKAQLLNIGDLTAEIDNAVLQSWPLLAENERFMYQRPADAVFFTTARMVVLGMNVPSAIPWLVGGVGLLTANAGFIEKVYRSKQADFLSAERKYLEGEISFNKYDGCVRRVAETTFVINGITRALSSMGLVLGGSSMGLAGVMLGNVESASGNIAKNSQSMIGASEVRSNLYIKLNELKIALSSQINTEEEYEQHKDRDIYPHAPTWLWIELLGGYIENAVIIDMEWGENERKKVAKSVIDFSNRRDGAFYIFGSNGEGKSTLVRSLLQRDKRHSGFGGLWINGKELLDFHNGTLEDVRSIARLFDVSEVRNMKGSMSKALGSTEAVRLLNRFGFGELIRLVETNISSLSDKSQGEQIIIGAITFLEKAKREGVKLVILDELFGKIDDNNVSKLKFVIDEYVKDGLMAIVVGQDPFKMGATLKNIRGAVVDQNGLSYYDQSIFNALESLNDQNKVHRLTDPLAWKSMLGLNLEPHLDEIKAWQFCVDNAQLAVERLNTLFNLSLEWADGRAIGLITGLYGLSDKEVGVMTNGFIKKWNTIFDSLDLSTDSQEKNIKLLPRDLSCKLIVELKIMKNILGILKGKDTLADPVYYGEDVTRNMIKGYENIFVEVDKLWLSDEMAEYLKRKNEIKLSLRSVCDLILSRDLYYGMDMAPGIDVLAR